MADTRKNKAEAIQKELGAIALANRGLLQPRKVVDWAAKHPDSAIYSRLTWDNDAAADAYRLWQARELIAVHVEVIRRDHPAVRTYVSLEADRKQEHGGYRLMVDVLKDSECREALLKQAEGEFQRWKAKYVALKELAPVFAAMEAAMQKHRRAKRPGRNGKAGGRVRSPKALA